MTVAVAGAVAAGASGGGGSAPVPVGLWPVSGATLSGAAAVDGGSVDTVADTATADGEQDFTQSGAHKPTYVAADAGANNQPTLRFTASATQYLTAGNVLNPGAASFAILVPIRFATDVDAEIIGKRTLGVGDGGASPGFYLRYIGGSLVAHVDDGAGNYAEVTAAPADAPGNAVGSGLVSTSMQLLEIHYDASTSTVKLYQNRALLGSNTAASALGAVTSAVDLLLGIVTGGGAVDGWIGDVRMYFTDLQGADLTSIRDAYTTQYGTP